MVELRPFADTRETDRNAAELAAVLDLLWRKLHGIHEEEITRTAARLCQASGETRAAVEALSITILRAVFARCSAALFAPTETTRASIARACSRSCSTCAKNEHDDAVDRAAGRGASL